MWYEIDPGVITKRVLTPDDARGVCAIYSPAAPSIPACAQNSPDDGCGCDTSGQGRGSLVAPGLVALALLVARRRRRSQGR
jgi:MYXO-CTERM domain-containing protein